MSTRWITCHCGFVIGSAQAQVGYEEGYHPGCRPFKQARVLCMDYLHESVYEALTLTLVEANLDEGMEIMIFDLTEPFRPFTKNSFPKGGME